MSREFALAVMDKCEWTVVSFVTPTLRKRAGR